MQLSELQSLIGSLANDPQHDRYSIADINTELDNSQDSWNVEAKIIKDTVTLTVVAGTRTYALSGLTGTPIAFPRTTLNGRILYKRSKTYFDHISARDWTQDAGSPTDFFVEVTDPANQYIGLYPTPEANDAGPYLVVEYTKRHTPMFAPTDVPFMSGTETNYILRPYDWGLAYAVASKLLLRDPNDANAKKSQDYRNMAEGVKSEVIQVFKQLEAEEPQRLSGGRYWKTGYLRFLK